MPLHKTDVLSRTELFGGLNREVLELLAGRAVEKRLERNEILFLAGDPADGMFVLASGSVRAFRTSADGREQVIHVEKAVTTIAEVPVFDDGNYPSTVAAEEPTVVYFLHKRDIRFVSIKHPELALAAAKVLAGRLRRCAELVETLSLREVGQRLAKVLLQEAATRGVKTPVGIRFDLKLTHNQLAARIGTVREVVTRAITKLQSQGLVELEGKRVTIPDVGALESYGDLS